MKLYQKNKRISNEIKAKIINKINDFEGFKDLKCLSSWLLFSGEQVATLDELFKHDFWHCVRQSDYPEATGYLDDIEVVSESFHQLLPRFHDKEKVLFDSLTHLIFAQDRKAISRKITLI
ncbi:Uncharacterised protein [Mannheimia haemolytica]|uniref:Uncharacterized protein n=1 Tax=Mannheimia haemolytica TaxID=75985 RepID=A0A378MTH0_MANHA|nr:Uncharacterised protein [Mannheimia haemolytica]